MIPTDPDPDAAANSDERKAAELIIDQIGGPAESTGFLFSLARRRCALLVAHYSGRLMFFKTDPALHGLAADEACQSFLRGMNLPGRLH